MICYHGGGLGWADGRFNVECCSIGPVIGMLEFCGLVGVGWNVGMLECG